MNRSAASPAVSLVRAHPEAADPATAVTATMHPVRCMMRCAQSAANLARFRSSPALTDRLCAAIASEATGNCEESHPFVDANQPIGIIVGGPFFCEIVLQKARLTAGF